LTVGGAAASLAGPLVGDNGVPTLRGIAVAANQLQIIDHKTNALLHY
jgi:hypothetical protein